MFLYINKHEIKNKLIYKPILKNILSKTLYFFFNIFNKPKYLSPILYLGVRKVNLFVTLESIFLYISYSDWLDINNSAPSTKT